MDREVHKIFKEKIMKRVTGLGGVFLQNERSKNAGRMNINVTYVYH